jgi:hypothetical protein
MATRKVLSTFLLILGVGFFVAGSYIASEAAQGEERVLEAEANEQGHRRPTLGPVRRHARAQASENAQEKISEAGQKIARSEVTANWLRGTGIVLSIIGIVNFSRKKRD